MFKRILAVTIRDVKSGVRDFLSIYIMIAPVIFALILMLIIPGVNDSTLKVAVSDDINKEFYEYLNEYAIIESFDNIDEINNRVKKRDDIFGVIEKDNDYQIIQDGNEMKGTIDILQNILFVYSNDTKIPIEISVSDTGWKLSPIKHEGTSMVLIMLSILGGMLILLSLVEEKMSNTLSAINVSSISKTEFVIGKSIQGILMPILGSFVVVLILGFNNIDYLKLLVSTISISLISLIIGFFIGVNNDEPIGAIANMKIILVPMIGSILGAMYISEKWIFLLYWSPFYWAYKSVRAILINEALWSEILLNSSIILFISVAIFTLLSKKIKQGMN